MWASDVWGILALSHLAQALHTIWWLHCYPSETDIEGPCHTENSNEHPFDRNTKSTYQYKSLFEGEHEQDADGVSGIHRAKYQVHFQKHK